MRFPFHTTLPSIKNTKSEPTTDYYYYYCLTMFRPSLIALACLAATFVRPTDSALDYSKVLSLAKHEDATNRLLQDDICEAESDASAACFETEAEKCINNETDCTALLACDPCTDTLQAASADAVANGATCADSAGVIRDFLNCCTPCMDEQVAVQQCISESICGCFSLEGDSCTYLDVSSDPGAGGGSGVNRVYTAGVVVSVLLVTGPLALLW